jgi:hypothetical protein
MKYFSAQVRVWSSQKFCKLKDTAALLSKAEIGGVTDTQAREPIAQGCEPTLLDLRARTTTSTTFAPTRKTKGTCVYSHGVPS